MAVYSIGRRTTATTISLSALAIYTGATYRASVLEAGVFQAAATAASVGVGRPAANGVTPTTPVLLQAETAGDGASSVNSALAWGTSPTNPTEYFRRFAGPATIGVGVIWTFPRGIALAVSSNFVLQNITATGVMDAYFVVDE